MDLTLYWFMFPVSILIATLAMMSGIGGAAFFMPIFILIFPFMGPEYLLAGPGAAIAVALLTQTFGFMSGFAGYYYKNLIDFAMSRSFLLPAVPAAILGALLSQTVHQAWIRGGYGILIILLAMTLLRRRDEMDTVGIHSDDVPAPATRQIGQRRITARNGNIYTYKLYQAQQIPTCLGGFLTGMLSVGIGEVVIPQLVKAGKVPAPVAAATSIIVVIVTGFSASVIHVVTMLHADGVTGFPWHLVLYTIPGVIIGGQLGPYLQGRIHSHIMERIIGGIFLLIGVAMLSTVM